MQDLARNHSSSNYLGKLGEHIVLILFYHPVANKLSLAIINGSVIVCMYYLLCMRVLKMKMEKELS